MSRLKNLKILVVDDEEEILEIVSTDLEIEGATVAKASSGKNAIEVSMNFQPHIVLSDYRMPNGDGLFVLTELKKTNVYAPVVLFLTGFTDLTIEDAFNFGADAVIHKPYNSESLIQKLIDVSMEIRPRLQSKVRVNINDALAVELQDQKKVYVGEWGNIGRGGAFIKCDQNFPKSGAEITFNCKLKSGELLIGRGIVRWTRETKLQSLEGATGFGIEFTALTDDSMQVVENIIKHSSIIPYIPKS